MAVGFGRPIDRSVGVLPGLDLAVEVRRMHAEARHLDAIKALRTELPEDRLSAALDWYMALTGWKPAYKRVNPDAAALLRLADSLHTLAAEAQKLAR